MKSASLLALMIAALRCATAASPQEAVRSITEVSENVYRFQSDAHFGAFLVTSEGIVVADPIDRATAGWLKGELAKRFKVPVTHVLYSHHHWDHASGAAVFGNARVISHRNTLAALQAPGSRAPLPEWEASLDTDGNGLLQRAEASKDSQIATNFDSWDTDRNGTIGARELFLGEYADVRRPDETYAEDEYTLKLGGQTVTLHHVVSSHAADMSYIMFPGRNLFVVDVISIKALPFGTLFGGFHRDDLNRTVDAALSLDPAVVMGGHGGVGNRADIEAFRQYHLDLRVEVQAGIDAGQSLSEIQKRVTMNPYRSWSNYSRWLPMNVEGMYRHLAASN